MGGLIPFAGPALKLGAGVGGLIGSARARSQANSSANSQSVPQYNPYANGNPLSAAMDLQSAANEQEAKALEAQGAIAAAEAEQSAVQRAREVKSFASNQALQFSSHGTSLVGSPSALAVLNETRVLGKQETNAIVARGAAQQDLANRRADIARLEGRSTLLGSQAQWDANALNFQSQQGLARMDAQRNTGGPSGFANLLGTVGDSITGLYRAGTKRKGKASFPNSVPGPFYNQGQTSNVPDPLSPWF